MCRTPITLSVASSALRFLALGVRTWPVIAALLATAISPLFAATLPPVVRGCKAVLLKPETGPLTVKIFKRDLNIYSAADPVTFLLYGPDRALLGSAFVPDDGQERSGPRPFQSATIEVDCKLPGVYRLIVDGNLSDDFIFGLELSQGKYMVEGGALLNDGSSRAGLWFGPPPEKTLIRAQALHAPGRQKAPLFDARGAMIHTFDLGKTGQWQQLEVGAELSARPGPWRLEIARADVNVQWGGDAFWTADADAYFPAWESRFMLFPYSQTRYLQPGQSADVIFRLTNQTRSKQSFRLDVLSDSGLTCKIVEPSSPLTVPASRYGSSRDVVVRVTAPRNAAAGRELKAWLKATGATNEGPVGVAGVRAVIGTPAFPPSAKPIVLERYQHENQQFGYAPDYIPNEIHFDRDNRPFIRHRKANKYATEALTVLEDGRWAWRPFVESVREACAGFRGFYMGGGFMGAKVAFDGDNGAYTLLRAMRTGNPDQNLLLFTPDRGRTYSVHPFEGTSFDIEQFTGHNRLDIPPPVLGYRYTRPHPATYCSYHDLLLYLPQRRNGKLEMGDPALISDNCLGSCQHSGAPASTATRGGRTHVVWGEVAAESEPGVPTYIATFDHASRRLSEKVFLAHGAPVNDVHNVPAITLDSRGYIHVVTGAHGANFKYLRSREPNSIGPGFTAPANTLDAGYVDDRTGAPGSGRQTYASLVCGPDDTLHIGFRQWRRGVDPYHDGANYAALSIQSKPTGRPWGPALPRVVPPVASYSIFYHKLTIDRTGNLYLAYSYLTADATYQNDLPAVTVDPAIQFSADGARTWKLLETRDLPSR